MNYGYTFYFDTPYGVLTFPITPEELTVTSGSKNETVTLISEGDVNILKSPSLIEIEFDARFPMRQYPYSREAKDFQSYFDTFTKLKEEKKSFRFIVTRTTPNGTRTWDTNLLVALEDLKTNESVEEGDDVIVSFSLKQYKEYGVKILQKASNSSTSASNSNTTSTASESRSTATKKSSSKTYTIKSGDTLWGIAKKFYGSGSKWTTIYNANKSVIESAAKKHGKASSSNGHWIYPGTKLTIPAASSSSSKSSSKSNSSSTNKSTSTSASTTGGGGRSDLPPTFTDNPVFIGGITGGGGSASTTGGGGRSDLTPTSTYSEYVMPVVNDIKRNDMSTRANPSGVSYYIKSAENK